MSFGKYLSWGRLSLGILAVSTAFATASVLNAAEEELSIFPGGGQTAVESDSLSDDSDAATNNNAATNDNSRLTQGRTLDLNRIDRSARDRLSIEGDAPAGDLPALRRRVEIRVTPERKGPEDILLPLPEGVTVDPEKEVQAVTALTEIPTGEGYEATVSANTQGKLILLGRQQKDADGNPAVDEEGNPVMIPMHRGMVVEEGEILGVQFNQAFHARRNAAIKELEVAKKEAGKQLEVDVAEASKNVAFMEYQRALNSNKRVANSVSEDEVWQKKFEWFRGVKSEDKAKYDLEIAALQVDVKEAAIAVADAELEERLIRAPLSGQVDAITTNKGEWLREGDPVLHILRLDKVNITARFDSATTTPSMVQGKAVTVYATKAGLPPQKLDGVITYARPVLEMNQFTAYAEVKNTQIDGNWFLIPGMRVNLIVHKDQEGVRESDDAK